jgi:hypothetical protein
MRNSITQTNFIKNVKIFKPLINLYNFLLQSYNILNMYLFKALNIQ